MKQVFELFLMYDTTAYPAPRYSAHAFDMSSIGGYTLVNKQTVELDIPDDFDPLAAQVAALNAERETVAKEFSRKLMEIDDQLGKLLCLTNEAPA